MRSDNWETKPALTREHLAKIVATVPGFRESWDDFLQLYGSEGSPPWYLLMADLAHYIVENYAGGTTAEFENLFLSIEAVLQNPHPELEGLLTVGLFEDMQNIASHRSFGPEVFIRWLRPRSLANWQEVEAFWDRVAESTSSDPARRTFDAERALSQVQNPELRKIIESNYRRSRKKSGV